MKKRHNVFKTIKNIASIVGVFVLTILVYKTSSSLMSNSLTENFKIDKTTSNYLSFNYTNNDSIYEIDNPKVISDFGGKRLLNEYYDFEVSIPEESITSEEVEYEVIIKDMGNMIDGKFIKFYLTNQNNDAFKGFDKTIPVYTAFSDSIDGKVIYTGTFTKNDLNDKFRLRIWVSNAYDKEINSDLAYQINVKIK